MALILGAALMLTTTMDPGDIHALADEAGVSASDLQAAAASVGVSPYTYLVGEGLIGVSESTPNSPRISSDPAVERLLDCISWYESKDTPGARNPSSGAAGQYQFLSSTWRGTPQGRAGLSPYDPLAAREAARWMILQGRKREWTVVARGLCG